MTPLTTGGFDYHGSRTASGDFGNVSGSDDGTPDWLIAHHQPGGGVLLWVVGGGADTTPRIWADLRTGGWSWQDSRQLVGDVDGDGLDDVVTVHRNVTAPGAVGTNVWVHRNTGSGFADPQLWRTMPPTTGLAGGLDPFHAVRYLLGDTNGDGLDDLVTVDNGAVALDPVFPGASGAGVRYTIWPNDGQRFARAFGWNLGPAAEGWSFVGSRDLLADVNGDDREELLTVHGQPGDGVLVWVRTGDGIEYISTELMTDLRTGGWSFSRSRQEAADVDGDRSDDLVSVHHQPDGGILLWAHRTSTLTSLELPVLLSDLRTGGWQYSTSRETVGFAH